MTRDEIEAAERLRDACEAFRSTGPIEATFSLSDISLVANAALSPSPVQAGAGVRVKPLEWRAIGDQWQADTSIGWYSVRPDEADGFTHSLFLSTSPIRAFKSADDAKAAAQANYAARILSALSPSPPVRVSAPQDGQVGELVERLLKPTEVGWAAPGWVLAILVRLDNERREAASALTSLSEKPCAKLESAEARIRELETALSDMLPENCGMGDDPSGRGRPGFAKCERARSLIKKDTDRG